MPLSCACYVSLSVAQFHTPLNTAVSMAFCSSGAGQMKREENVEKKWRVMKKTERIETQLMKKVETDA